MRLLPGIYVTAARKDYSKMATILLKCAMHCASNSSFLSSSGSSSIFLLLMPSVWCYMINSAKTDPECYFSGVSLGKRSLELETEFLGQILFLNVFQVLLLSYKKRIIRTARPKLKGHTKYANFISTPFVWKILMRKNVHKCSQFWDHFPL